MRKETIPIMLINVILLVLFLVLPQRTFAIDNCSEGWKIDVGTGNRKTIDCYGTCRIITNNCSASIFIPTKTHQEWQEFLTNLPSCISISNCGFVLSVSKLGSGSGTVTSNPSGINCGSTCSASFAANVQVTLSAIPYSISVFERWIGDCSGSSCILQMNSNKSVIAIFNEISAPEPPPECSTDRDCPRGECYCTKPPGYLMCGELVCTSYSCSRGQCVRRVYRYSCIIDCCPSRCLNGVYCAC